MFFSSLPTSAFDLASWVWRHREELPSLPLDAADLVQQTIENGGEGIRRIGSSIVFGTPDGGQQVLAFIDQAPPQLGALEAGQQAMNASLGVLDAGQQAISSSLSSLQTQF